MQASSMQARSWSYRPATIRYWTVACLMVIFATTYTHAIPRPGSLLYQHRDIYYDDSNLRVAIITAQTKHVLLGNETREFLHLSPEYSGLFIQNKKDWASYQKYDYVHTVIDTDDAESDSLTPDMVERSIQWVKIDLLQKYLHKYDWLCWLDMDAIVVDPTVQLETYIRQAVAFRPQTDLIIEGSEDYKKLDGAAIKSGVVIVRNSVWMQRLLSQLKDILADNEWEAILSEAMYRKSKSRYLLFLGLTY